MNLYICEYNKVYKLDVYEYINKIKICCKYEDDNFLMEVCIRKFLIESFE